LWSSQVAPLKKKTTEKHHHTLEEKIGANLKDLSIETVQNNTQSYNGLGSHFMNITTKAQTAKHKNRSGTENPFHRKGFATYRKYL
jgi:hypothetical protein